MKRTMKSAAAALFAAFIFAGALAEPLCVVSPHVAALVSDSGEDILAGDFSEVFSLEGTDLYLCGDPGNYLIVDADGSALTDMTVGMARAMDGVIIFRLEGLYGAMNEHGDILVEPSWRQLTLNGEGGYLALYDYPMDNVSNEIVYIDPEGEVVYTGNYTVGTLQDVRDGRMPYMTSAGKCGYVDARGNIVIEGDWMYAGEFINGIAHVSDENGHGLIDADGNTVLECVNRFILRGSGVIAVISGEDMLSVFSDDMGEELFSVDAEGASVSLVGDKIALMNEEEARLLDKRGNIIFVGSGASAFIEGADGQTIISDGKWGEACQWILNSDGSDASARYQRILPLSDERYAFLTMHGANYYSDDLGGMQKSWDYESVRYGMIDGKGNEILPAEYIEIRPLGQKRFLLVQEWESIIADENGNIIRAWIVPEEERTIDSEYGAGID